MLIIIVLVILAGTIYGIALAKYDGNVKSALLSFVSNFTEEVETRYVLVLGVSEDISAELTDTIILGGYNPMTQKAFMVSIPRDTFVGASKTRATAFDKINAKYQKGVDQTIEAVENLTNIEIDNYIVVKNSMLIEIVDLIGGVQFDVPIDMKYDDPSQDLHINLKKGLQTIDGDKAEQLLRFRHNNNGTSYPASYGDNDFGRMRTTREFMKATVKQTITVKNIPKIKDIINTVSDNLVTDLSKEDMIAYAVKLAEFNTDNLKSEVIPGESKMINRISFFEAYENQTLDLLEECQNYINETEETKSTNETK